MKNIKNVKAIIKTKTKHHLPLICTASVLVLSAVSAQAQLSIYGGNESANTNKKSYNNYTYNNSYSSNNNAYTKSAPAYPTTNYQQNSYNSYRPSNTYYKPSNSYNNPYNHSYNNSYSNAYNKSYNTYNNSYNSQNNLDKLGGLIEKKASEYQYQTTILDNARISAQDRVFDDIYEANSFSNSNYYLDSRPTFESWQNKYGNRLRVKAYRQYLVKHLGASNVPPMSQLLKTAKSWRKCGGEPYSVPPIFYWHNMVPTLRLFNLLKAQGILPQDTQINSVYRTSKLNKCAGGARGSKHKFNAALDLSSASMKSYPFKLRQVQNDICNFWLYQGRYYNFGLGLYSGGSIHIDTSKYRKWGNSHSSRSSPCRSSSFF